MYTVSLCCGVPLHMSSEHGTKSRLTCQQICERGSPTSLPSHCRKLDLRIKLTQKWSSLEHCCAKLEAYLCYTTGSCAYIEVLLCCVMMHLQTASYVIENSMKRMYIPCTTGRKPKAQVPRLPARALPVLPAQPKSRRIHPCPPFPAFYV